MWWRLQRTKPCNEQQHVTYYNIPSQHNLSCSFYLVPPALFLPFPVPLLFFDSFVSGNVSINWHFVSVLSRRKCRKYPNNVLLFSFETRTLRAATCLGADEGGVNRRWQSRRLAITDEYSSCLLLRNPFVSILSAFLYAVIPVIHCNNNHSRCLL